MQIYIVRTDIDYQVPNICGYCTQRETAEQRRLSMLTDGAVDEEENLIVEEVTLDQDITQPWQVAQEDA